MNEKYYHTKNSVDEYIKSAEGFNGKELIVQLVKFLQTDASILELGTGPGSDWHILNLDFKVIGSDSSGEFLKRLKSKYPKGEFIHLDAVSLQTDKTFDAIYSNKVLHHLNGEELVNSFSKQFDLLNKNGVICHSFWKGKGHEIFKGMYVNYVFESDLTELLKDQFEIILMESYAEFEENDSILLIARKK